MSTGHSSHTSHTVGATNVGSTRIRSHMEFPNRPAIITFPGGLLRRTVVTKRLGSDYVYHIAALVGDS